VKIGTFFLLDGKFSNAVYYLKLVLITLLDGKIYKSFTKWMINRSFLHVSTSKNVVLFIGFFFFDRQIRPFTKMSFLAYLMI